MAYTITYESPTGTVWELTKPTSNATIIEASIDGLIGQINEQAIVPIQTPGQMFHGINVEAMRGGFEVLLYTEPGSEPGELADLVRQFRTSFSTREHGTLTIAGGSHGTVHTKVRLESPIAAPPTDPDNLHAARVQVRLVSDEGVWWSEPKTGQGNVAITNTGDVPIHPRVRWSGSDQWIRQPSGTVISLPTVSSTRVLVLDNAESNVVLKENGTVDYTTWKKLAPRTNPESIAPGMTRNYRGSTATHVEWRAGYLDPWQ